MSRTQQVIERELRLFKNVIKKNSEEIHNLLHEDTSQMNQTICETLLSETAVNLEKYSRAVEELMCALGDTTDVSKEQEVFEELATLNLNVAKITSEVKLAAQEFPNSSQSQSENSQIATNLISKRSRIKYEDLPTFDGTMSKFLDFKGYFETMVHDDSTIPLKEKLLALRKCLKDSAAEVLRDLPPGEDAYTIAWEAVLDRYEDKIDIIDSYLREFIFLPRITHESKLRELMDRITRSLRGLKASKENPDNWSTIITFLVYSKLDFQTQKDWQKTISDRTKYPNWKEFEAFLLNRAKAVKQLEDKQKSSKKAYNVTSNKNEKYVRKCVACQKSDHLLFSCETFNKMTAGERLDLVRNNKLCYNCFNRNHHTRECEVRKCCKICGYKHHTLLHIEKNSTKSTSSSVDSNAKQVVNDTNNVNNVTELSNEKKGFTVARPNGDAAMLPSAVVKFVSKFKRGNARALLDACSQVTLIGDAFVKINKIPVYSAEENPIAVGGLKATVNKFVELELRSRFNDFKIIIHADIVPQKALSYVASNIEDCDLLKKIHKYDLAETAITSKALSIANVDMLIGANYLPQIMNQEMVTIENILLQDTKFGWAVSGLWNQKPTNEKADSPSCFLTIQDIHDQLQKFWETENKENLEETSEHLKCTEHFEKTYTRTPEGKFSVRLPLKEDRTVLKNNRNKALAQFIRAEKNRPQECRQLYIDFMREYEALGHMTKIPSDPESKELRYYIPHRAVFRPEKTTSKLRVVFNAGFKTPSGKSLNDILMNGPVLQPEMFDTILKFRDYPVAFVADIEKMFRCIEVQPQDRALQTILWREREDEEISEYQLNTVTYGTVCGTFLATGCLQKLADEAQTERARDAIKNNFYVDDLLTGAQTISEALELQKEIHETLLSGGFKLRKYKSNSSDFLAQIDPDRIEESSSKTICGESGTSLLGLNWEPTSDVFRPKMNGISWNIEIVSKKTILAEISKVFDPIGLMSPVTVKGKLLMQSLWKSKIDWDVPVSGKIRAEFQKYIENLQKLQCFALPRCLSSLQNIVSKALFGYSDASEEVYSAAVYMRTENAIGEVSSHLICAKTKVGPINGSTIPRMELRAAELLAELLHRVEKILNVNKESVFAFSDSKVVLAWLSKPYDQWKAFVANRVKKIVSVVPSDRWFYVNTRENPADLATRPKNTEEFLKSDLWFYGPLFMREEWTIDSLKTRVINESVEIERRKLKLACKIVINEDNLYLYNFVKRFSSYNRLLIVFAHIQKFINRSRKLDLVNNENAKVLNYRKANIAIVKLIQKFEFSEEYESLLENNPLPKNSKLKSLLPFLDKEGVMRWSTRIINSNMSYDRKFPMILLAKSHFVTLLVRHVHVRYYHASNSFIYTFLSFMYKFVGDIKRVIKSEIHRCVTCVRYRGETKPQLMGDLPKERVTISRPFTTTGVDFAGPFDCRLIATRSKTTKIYLALFICFTTRAIHLELVFSLTSEDFLKSLKRFTNRRGLPNLMWSDRGTNFKGAAGYLDLQHDTIQSAVAKEGINWKFLLAKTPHRGGFWEAGVKAAKKPLLRQLKGVILNYDEYATLFTEIEGILNSRPLCYRTYGTSETEIITPGHFLIGDYMKAVPEPEDGQYKLKLSRRYHELKNRINQFFRVWSKDYMNQLQQRSKWLDAQPNLEVDQVVLLKDDETKPYEWPLARITKVFPVDGVVRTVEVFSKGKTSKKAVNFIIPLPKD